MSFKIVSDRLRLNTKPVAFVRANKSGGRFTPTLIVLHDTADRPTRSQDTVAWFANPRCRVSAHVIVGRDGSVTQMVDLDHKAWHAGRSSFKGRRSCNSFAIGIEIDSPGKLSKTGKAWFTGKNEAHIEGIEYAADKSHGKGWWLPYTPEQIKSVTAICKALVKEYKSITHLSTHYEISPGRKIDPSPLWDVQATKDAVFKPTPADLTLKIGSEGAKVKAAQTRLKELGYPVGGVDGIYGSQTRVAALGFQAENGLRPTGFLAPADVKMLNRAKAKSMPRAEREETTAKELMTAGSATVSYTRRGKSFLTWFGIPAIGSIALDDGGGVQVALKSLETARHTFGRGSELMWWLMTPKGLVLVIIAIVGFGGWWILERIEQRRVAKARNGTDLSV